MPILGTRGVLWLLLRIIHVKVDWKINATNCFQDDFQALFLHCHVLWKTLQMQDDSFWRNWRVWYRSTMCRIYVKGGNLKLFLHARSLVFTVPWKTLYLPKRLTNALLVLSRLPISLFYPVFKAPKHHSLKAISWSRLKASGTKRAVPLKTLYLPNDLTCCPSNKRNIQFTNRIKLNTGCPKKHGNSVTNSISSLLWISIVIPNFKSHNIIMSDRV